MISQFDLTPPPAATVREVGDGVLWLRMPLPFSLDHVNLWALRDRDGWALVDTGIGDDTTRALWERLLAGPLGGLPVTKVIATHFHPDHMGLAGWLAPRFGVPLTTSFGEWSSGRRGWLETEADYLVCKREHYRRAGYGPAFLAGIGDEGDSFRSLVSPIPPSFRRIGEGDSLAIGGRDWQVMTCGGHSPEHACLWCPEAGILIAGDQVLPRISPAIGVWPQEPEADPLARFLASLDRLGKLPEDTLVLPSHDHPFATLGPRCAQLTQHHATRLDQTRDACRQPANALQVLEILFPRALDQHQAAFATAETLAHLNRLIRLGTVERFDGDDAVWLYRAC